MAVGGVSFVRTHARAVLGLLNVLIAATSLQLVGSRAEGIGPTPFVPAPGVALEAGNIEALRIPPSGSQASAAAKSGAAAPLAVKPGTPAGELPIAGKGLWIWLFDMAEDGDPARIVRRAKTLGLSHIYVRSSSTTSGLKFLAHIDRILPVAHAAGLRVVAWDFPRLVNANADVRRLVAVLDHRSPGGHQVDGIAVDLETPAEGVALTKEKARYLAHELKSRRPDRFRVLVPPRPSRWTVTFYPYDIIRDFHAVAPMVYWMKAPAAALVRQSIAYLRKYDRPIAPIGQAYDASIDGGPGGAPSGRVLEAFAAQARASGAIGVSFWSWQHATGDQFLAIRKINFPAPSIPRAPKSTPPKRSGVPEPEPTE